MPVDSPEAVAATVEAGTRQPAGVGGDGDRGALPLARQAARLDARQPGPGARHDAARRPARSAPTPSNEPAYLADLINFYGSRAAKYIGEESIRPHSPLLASKKLRVQYRPYPVAGIISPWNFPLMLSLGDAVPALQAGCRGGDRAFGVHAIRDRRGGRSLEAPVGGPDVFDGVQGIGETGGALVDKVDFIQFTGSDRTGRKVMARAAETLTPVSLELGGKDPMIVLADADVGRAANAAAWGGMINSGQVCISVKRITSRSRSTTVRQEARGGGRQAAPGRRRRSAQKRSAR